MFTGDAKPSASRTISAKCWCDMQQKQAEATLNQFKENQDSWLLVDKILQEANYSQTKCKLHACTTRLLSANYNIVLGLQILDNVILTRWKVLPRDQCQGMLSLRLFSALRI